tara:strand:- start:218 stop:520 length:303 start_codon:yes stop_codon:yes gene_type:complete
LVVVVVVPFPCKGPVVLFMSLVETWSFSEVEGGFMFLAIGSFVTTFESRSTSTVGGADPSFVVVLVGIGTFGKIDGCILGSTGPFVVRSIFGVGGVLILI